MGSNKSYQRTGTMLHEMAHGVGIGTHDPYWSPHLRLDGDRGMWLGDRVTSVIRFWENSETATITGDKMHFCLTASTGLTKTTAPMRYISSTLCWFRLSEKTVCRRRTASPRRPVSSNRKLI